MNMNPKDMMAFMGAINTFKSNHPKFFAFVETVIKPGIPADTIIEISVQKPGEEKVTTNIMVKQSDLDLFESMNNIGR